MKCKDQCQSFSLPPAVLPRQEDLVLAWTLLSVIYGRDESDNAEAKNKGETGIKGPRTKDEGL